MDAQKNFGSDFLQTAKRRDLPGLRSHLASAIKWEPAVFRTPDGDYTRMRSYLLNDLHIDFKQPYERRPNEREELPREQWDEDYFFRLVEWYRLNCADERLKHIEEVGKAVASAPRAADAQRSDFHAVPEERRNRAEPKNRPSPALLWIIAALLLAVLLAAFLLVQSRRSQPQEGPSPELPSQSQESPLLPSQPGEISPQKIQPIHPNRPKPKSMSVWAPSVCPPAGKQAAAFFPNRQPRN